MFDCAWLPTVAGIAKYCPPTSTDFNLKSYLQLSCLQSDESTCYYKGYQKIYKI
jgi:hypothetical protein